MVVTLQARIFAALVASFCVLGLCLAFAQPLLSAPDEPMHWVTANVRLERLFGRDGCVPTIFQAACPREHTCSTVPKLQLACHEDPGLYGGVLTYPGVLLSKLVLSRQTESAVRQVQAMLLARLLQGLFVILCLVRVGVLARKTGRLGSLTLGAFMLSPLLAQQSFALSSDGAQLAFALILFACVMYWDALTRLDALAFLLLGYAASSKPTVLTLVLPAALAGYWFAQLDAREQEQTSSRLRELVRGLARLFKLDKDASPQTIIAWSALGLSLLTVVLALIHDADASVANASEDNARRGGHLQELRDRPGMIFELVTSLRFRPSRAHLWTSPLGWLDTFLSPVVIHSFRDTFWTMCGLELAAIVALVARQRSALAGAGARLVLTLPPLLIGLLAIVLNVLFLTAIMFVMWTPADAEHVAGVQMRYFLPTAIVLIALVFRAVQSIGLGAGARDLEFPPRTRWLSIAAPCLVLALSLPFVARLYVDLALRYHDPARYGVGP